MIQCSQNVKLQAVMMNFGDADFLSPGPFDFTDLQVSNIGAPRLVCLQLKSNALETQNLKTFNNLALAVCGQPGQLDACRFLQVMDGAFHAPTIGLESTMRQLSYEAITVAVATIRLHVEPQQEGQIKRLPPQGRVERIRKTICINYRIHHSGDYERAHAVVDFFTTMLEECAPRYLPLSKGISREQELQSQQRTTCGCATTTIPRAAVQTERTR